MADATVNRRLTSAQGPMRVERILITAPASPDNPDDVRTLLQDPQSVEIRARNVDLTGTASTSSAIQDTTDNKLIKLHDLTASRTYIVEVVGF